jgi:RimJ/RimL family protein N-acetyltransferase
MSVIEQIRCAATDPARRTHLRLVEEGDAAFVVALRADPDLGKHLSPPPASVQQQVDWTRRYKEREARLEELYFVIVHESRDVGVVRIYNIEGRKSFEWGSWIIGQPRPRGAALYSAVCIYEIAFDVLGFEKCHFEVRRDNTGVIDFHLRSGALETHSDDLNRYFEFLPSDYAAFKTSTADLVAKNREIL